MSLLERNRYVLAELQGVKRDGQPYLLKCAGPGCPYIEIVRWYPASRGMRQPLPLWELQVDHIHPRHLGGSDEIDNLQFLCQFCNASKGTRTDWKGRFT